MRVVVLMKQVPDTEAAIRVSVDGRGIVEDDIKWVMNPYCEFAVEEGLRAKERFGGEVVVVSVGPSRVVEAVRTALAMGCDRGILVDDGALWGASDSLGRGRVLARVVGEVGFDVVFCGRQAIDDDMAQVGSVVAELLGVPQLTFVNSLEWVDERTVRVGRQVEGGTQVLECGLPVVVTCQKGLNEPRYASLPGIMKAKKKPLDVRDLASLGLDPMQVGRAGDTTEVLRVEVPPARQAGKLVEGETPEEKASRLALLLRQEAKVI